MNKDKGLGLKTNCSVTSRVPHRSAFVVETSDDNWKTSTTYSISFSLIDAADDARKLCCPWRVRHAKVSIGGLLTDADIDNALETLDRIDMAFENNRKDTP